MDEHATSFESPWKFNEKELDSETGLYYCGARYYEPVLALWYGVDALAKKYSPHTHIAQTSHFGTMRDRNPRRSGNLLVVDDNKAILQSVRMLMEHDFAHIFCAPNPDAADATLGGETPDVILLDMNFHAGVNNGNEGLFWLGRFKTRWPNARIVLFTAYADVELAVRGLKEGAYDFVVKPWDNDRLKEALLTGQGDEGQKADAGEKMAGGVYWGDSAAMRALLKAADRVAKTDANVLITGENGTGKDVLAHYVHAHSARASSPLVSVDLGAVSETLFESELFGHKKGAFTGADSDRAGYFEAANGATLFLDEIGNLPLHLQAKLLTALQRRQVTRIGTNTPIDVDIRLICATNKNLWQMVAEGTFREDLLYRVNTIRLDIPPLRERTGDTVALAETFVRKFALRYGRDVTGLTAEARDSVARYTWPGNVRELEHAMEKAVIMTDGRLVGPDALDLTPPHAIKTPRRQAPPLATLDEMEADAIRRAVESSGGNMSQVAQRLGISRQTLYNKMKRYGI